MNNQLFNSIIVFLTFSFVSNLSKADGNSVGKIYHPYVQLLEQEFELQLITQNDESHEKDNLQALKVGYGKSLNEFFFLEANLIFEGKDFTYNTVEGYEIEAKIQLSEQGEYEFDYGLLFELERERGNAWESKTKLLLAKDFRQLTTLINFGIIYEWGEEINEEIESEFSGKLIYRKNMEFEPGIEIFLGESTQAVGPAASGIVKLQQGRKFLWDASLLKSIGKESPDLMLKFNVEYEFF